MQVGGIFTVFKAEAILGGATGLALSRELAPIITATVMTGRAGSAMTAEISTMKVNEQIEAMEAMAVDPIRYIACLLYTSPSPRDKRQSRMPSSA